MPYGIYGYFYEGGDLGSLKLKILPFPKIREGEARLLLPDGEGDFSEISVTLNPRYLTDIECCLVEGEAEDKNIDGAVVVQQGKIAAVVSGYDKERKKYSCVSSEIIAADLARMVYEQKIAEEMREKEM